MRALAAAGYHAGALVRSRRVVGPLAGLLLMLLGVYAYRPNPVAGTVATTAFLLFPLAAWLAVALAATEAPSQRDATASTLGGPGRAALARLGAGVAVGLVGVGLLVVAPLLVDAYDRPVHAGDIAWAVLVHAGALLAGLTLGGLVAPPVLRRSAAAMALVAVVWALGVPVDAAAADAPAAARPLLHAASPVAYAADAIGGGTAWPGAGTLVATVAAALAFAGAVVALALAALRWR